MDAPEASATAVITCEATGRASAHISDGAALLDEVYAYLGRFVSYPNIHAHVAHTLWIAHTHCMDAWDSTPRIAFLSPEPGSGKSRALEVTDRSCRDLRGG